MGRLPHLFAIAAASAPTPIRDVVVEAVADTVRVTLPSRGPTRAGIEVHAADPSRVATFFDEANDRALYLWGCAAHPQHSDPAGLLRWCNQALLEKSATSLRDLLGTFVLIVDDRRRGEISFASDVLAARPWFVGAHEGRLVAGSDALGLYDAGCSTGRIDYTAVSCWLKYNYDWTGGSLFEDLRRLTPGAVSTYDRAGKLLRQTDYARFEFADKTAPQERIVADVNDIVTRNFDVLLRDVPEVNLPLSGGYDSRYLFALAVAKKGLKVHAANVQSTASESTAATLVGEALGCPVKTIPVGCHTLDLFEDPFPLSAAGFPTGRNLVSAVARSHPGMPVLSGYLGDPLVRGGVDQCLGKSEREFPDGHDLAVVASEHHTLRTNRLDLLRDSVTAAVNERALTTVRAAIERGMPTGKPFFHSNLFARQRLYIANLFLQHLDVAEAILPFYSWELINYKTSHALSCFPFENYPALFRTHFPRLAQIPHDSQLRPPDTPSPTERPMRHLRRWSMSLLGALVCCSESTINRRKLAVRIPGGLLAQRRRQDEIMFLHKLHAFERRLRKSNLNLDWNAV